MKNLNSVRFEKEESNPREFITIEVSDYLTCELVERISLMQWHTNKPEFVNSVKHMLYDGKCYSNCFNVIAYNAATDIVGRLYCLQNQKNPQLWYYGDLAVAKEYRRQHIASKMLHAALETLQDRGCLTLRTYVEKDNYASLNLQKALGFTQKPYQKFDNLINDGELMFEKTLEAFCAAEATVNDAIFITMIFSKNADTLHCDAIMFDEWKHLLSLNDPDEKHFLIHKGALPVAYLKINGLMNRDTAWVSMLAVEPCMQHQGVGTFAISFAEEYIRSKGFSKIGIHTTDDNISAQNLYQKCGYTHTECGEYTTGDGEKQIRCTFKKDI